jgi:hypothetical protein
MSASSKTAFFLTTTSESSTSVVRTPANQQDQAAGRPKVDSHCFSMRTPDATHWFVQLPLSGCRLRQQIADLQAPPRRGRRTRSIERSLCLSWSPRERKNSLLTSQTELPRLFRMAARMACAHLLQGRQSMHTVSTARHEPRAQMLAHLFRKSESRFEQPGKYDVCRQGCDSMPPISGPAYQSY